MVTQSPQPRLKRTPLSTRLSPLLIPGFAFLYIGIFVLLPAVNVLVEAFAKGLPLFLQNLQNEQLLQSVKLTLLMLVIAVPANTVFGLAAAWAIARRQFPGKTLLLSIIDLPFSISPVVAGLMLVLLYGNFGLLGPWLQAHDIKVVFAWPGMALATIIVTFPFMAREVIPSLEEEGWDQEEAARTLGATDWQVFWKVTLPSVKWSVLYGLILTTARAAGEFGAVSVVSGSIAGETQTLPLFVEEAYKSYQTELAYAAALLLATIAIVTLLLKTLLEQRLGRRSGGH